MFTGIIRHVGTVRVVRRAGQALALGVDGGAPAGDVAPGDSVSVNGACLTASAVEEGRITFDVSAETLRLTTLSDLREGVAVNLEPALRLGDRLGGHFVSGHVDGTGVVLQKKELPGEVRLEVQVDESLTDLMVLKGSVAVDGISLTIAALRRGAFEVSLIPHTLKATTLSRVKGGDRVNIECDMIGRWLRRLLGSHGDSNGGRALSVEGLEEQGF